MTVPATGWYVEIDNPSSGYTHTPEVLDGVSRKPTVNGLPGIEIPVARNDRWQDLVDNNPNTNISMRVWHDGKRQPVDELERTSDQPDKTVLIGRGGVELLKQVEKSVDQQETHLVAQELIENNTNYTANVDAPSTSTEIDQPLASISSTAEWNSRVAISDTDPFGVSSGSLQIQDTNKSAAGAADRENNEWGFDLDEPDADTGAVILSSNAGDTVEYTITTDVDIPTKNGNLEFRRRDRVDNLTGDADVVDIYLDGEKIERVSLINGVNFSVRGTDLDLGGVLPAGEHKITLQVVSEQDNDYELDWLALGDGRYNYSDRFNDLKPDAAKIVTDEIPATKAVTGGRAEANITVQGIELSNDQGDSFEVSGTSTDTVDGDFSSPSRGPSLTARIELGRTHTTISSLDLKADLEDMPLTVNKSLSGRLLNLLTNDLAEPTNQIWTYERDGSTESVEWTQPGARSTTEDPALTDFDTSTTKQQIVNKAIVFGRSQQRRGEKFEADHGTAVPLAKSELHEQSQVVRDPDTGATFKRGPDYAINWQDGSITTQSDGDMDDGSTYAIDYQFQSRGVFDNGSGTPRTTEVVELPGLTTEMTCEQAARILVDETSIPLIEATARAPPEELSFSLVEEISISDLPTSGPLDFRNVEVEAGQLILTLGSRRSFEDVVRSLRTQLSTVSRRT